MKLRSPLVHANGALWTSGTGSPEGVVAAAVGSLYSRVDGGADTAVYRKEAGTGNTGWVPVADVYVGANAPPGSPNVGDLWYDSDEPTGGLILPLTVADGGTGATTPAAARTNLGINLPLAIADGGTGSTTSSAARTSLGVPATPVAITDGGTGGTTAAAARASLAVPAVGNSSSTAGAPTTGTWARGDQWLDSANYVWTCITAGTPGTWMPPVGYEYAYAQGTAAVNVTATSEGTSNLILDSGTRNYDGSPVYIEFNCHVTATNPASAQVIFTLWDLSASTGLFAMVYASGANLNVAVHVRRRLTPTPGSHNYRIGAYCAQGTGSLVYGGPGGAGQWLPMYVRLVRA